MDTKVDSKSVVTDAKGGGTRLTFSVRIDSTLMEGFKDVCEDEKVSTAKMLESLIRAFLKDYSSKGRKKG